MNDVLYIVYIFMFVLGPVLSVVAPLAVVPVLMRKAGVDKVKTAAWAENYASKISPHTLLNFLKDVLSTLAAARAEKDKTSKTKEVEPEPEALSLRAVPSSDDKPE